MITNIKGKIIKIGIDWLDIDLGPIAFRVNVPNSSISSIGKTGDTVSLFTSMQVREDSMTLYGFESDESRSSFESLISINGVGPRLGLAIMSMFSVSDLRHAVNTEDQLAFSRVPGVGKKTAGRIILELKGQLAKDLSSMDSVDSSTEVLEALTALGYSINEAREAVRLSETEADLPMEERVRSALEHLSG
ncbi:MAG: Holliday junction branch migration protein RuvA [Dehalococcoidia bacterium]|nr:Holliday junction branch migration protein RuvA [Dehalococcoidia bacterium]MQG16162.1 Holliday junction branch migration protein RuvA [SAR202 cluster bacterium]|tara:strand:- start:19090 stop:19662 length:573 start_codon:yes stop_codon:yes gene_type:complete